MLRFLLTRALHSFVSLVGLLLLVFVVSRLTGDPASLYLPYNAPPETREAFLQRFGLDDPIHIQLLHYCLDILRFDFGQSIRQARPAMDAVMQALPNTLFLVMISISLATVLAVVGGVLAAYRKGGLFDRVATLVSLGFASMPEFWLAIVGVLVFAIQLGLLPTSGMGGWQYWIMPALVLAARPFGLLLQVVRSTMLDVMSSPYIRTAHAKGVPDRQILFSHALRNSMLPLITVAGQFLVNAINGAVVIEVVFGWPGIGRLLIDAIIERDFPVVQAAVLVTATAVFIVNIVIDVLYTVVDPRLRTAAA